MSRILAAGPSRRPSLPFQAERFPLPVQVLAVLAGTAVLTASSWIQVPLAPVPVTLQTLAVTLIGAACGWRMAGIIVAAWLVEAAIGVPVLAGGASGLPYMMGPTGGYLAAFLPVAAAVGWTAERGWLGRSWMHAGAIMVGANLLILAVGAGWLAVFVGESAAVARGVVPFLVGGALKAGLAAGLVEAWNRSVRRGRARR